MPAKVPLLSQCANRCSGLVGWTTPPCSLSLSPYGGSSKGCVFPSLDANSNQMQPHPAVLVQHAKPLLLRDRQTLTLVHQDGDAGWCRLDRSSHLFSKLMTEGAQRLKCGEAFKLYNSVAILKMNTVTLFLPKERMGSGTNIRFPYLSGKYYFVYKLVVKYKKIVKTLNHSCSPCS